MGYGFPGGTQMGWLKLRLCAMVQQCYHFVWSTNKMSSVILPNSQKHMPVKQTFNAIRKCHDPSTYIDILEGPPVFPVKVLPI